MLARPEDEQALQAYFDASPDETVWLRLAWSERNPLALATDSGRVTAMASHTAGGVVFVHGQRGLADVVQEAVRPELPIRAVAGLPEQMRAAIDTLGLSARPVTKVNREILMSVELDRLVLPDLLKQPGVVSRRAQKSDVLQLIDWRIRYYNEVYASTPSDAAFAEVVDTQAQGRLWVLEIDGELVNTAAFNAVFPRLVQIEYAYGPPETRAKQYGRSAVAGALAAVKAEGITRAVFNTFESNVAVQTGIAPIGFRKTADFHVTRFADAT